VADLDGLKAAIARVEQQLAEARAQLRESEATIERLNAARVEAEGRSAITRRAVSDFEDRLEEQRQALVSATREAAAAGYERAVRERDAAVEQAMAAVRTLIAAFEALNAARESVAKAAQEARHARAVVPSLPPAESSVSEEEWRRLHELLGAQSQARLDEELLAAAARSGNPLVIEKLPPHLREAARARVRARVRAADDEARRRSSQA
jgi:chromosome segregation ATPase